MNYKVEVGKVFKKQAKRLIQKYPSLKSDLDALVSALELNPVQDNPIGKQCYKIRLASHQREKEKAEKRGSSALSGVTRQSVVLLSIYDKSEQENISDQQIKLLLSQLPE